MPSFHLVFLTGTGENLLMTFSGYNRQVPLHFFLPKYHHLENEAGRTPLPLREYQTDKEPKTLELVLHSYLRYLQSAPLIPEENSPLLLLTPTAPLLSQVLILL